MYLLLAVAAALAASAAQSPSHVYESNKEYIYEYETQALTGIPQGSTIYSGMKIKSDIKIQFRSRSSATLKMDKIRIGRINDPIESVNPTQQQVPEEYFRPLVGKDAEQMVKDLSKPINFRYIRGNVRDIQQEADDPEWSVNVKKGLLSIMEMNLEKRKRLQHSSSIPQVLRPLSSNEGYIYNVMEPSIGGECETLYKVKPLTSTSGDPQIYVTKVRNYDNCINRPKYFASIFHGKQCAECMKARSEPLKSVSLVRYTLKGSTRLFQIQSAISESQHVFTPYSDKGGSIATYLNQTLNLVKVGVVKESLSQPKNRMKVNDGLMYASREIESRNEHSGSSQQSPSSKQSPTPKPISQLLQKTANQSKERIWKLLKMLEEFMKPYIQEEAGPLMMSLLEEIRKADVESLKAVFRETVQTASSDKKKLKMLMDMLPSAGTAPATEVLVDAILNDQISKPEAIIALNILSLSARPEVLIAKKLLDLTQSSKLSQNRVLKRTAFLCLGAVAGKLSEEEREWYREMSQQEATVRTLLAKESNSQSRKELKSKKVELEDRKKKEKRIHTQFKQEIVKEIQMLMKSTVLDDKMLSFKTAGNAGLRELIPSVRTYIEDKSQPQMLRTQAIYSLRKLTSRYPYDIHSILLPRYFDRTEKEEVRISSYLVVASTDPSRQILEMVAHSLHKETNPHVGTFVYTHLEQLSNSTYPCLLSWAKNATFALRFAKKFNPMFYYSRFLHLSGYSDNVKMGAAVDLGLITSPEEFIPRAGAVHLNTHVLGSSINLAEVGFNTEGLQTLVSKLVSPLNELTKDKSVVEVLKQRMRRSTQSQETPSDPISQIHQKLKVSPRTSPDPKGHLYIKLMGNELQYLTLDSHLVETLLKEGKILLGVTEQKLSSGLDLDIHKSLVPLDADTMIPTESGLPLRMKLRGMAAIKVTGKVSVSGLPSIFKIIRADQLKKDITLNLELKPSVFVDIRGEMEMDAVYFKSGVSIKTMAHVETPLSVSASVNLPKAKVIAKVNVEKLSERVAKLEISPSAYLKEVPSDISKYPRPREVQDIRAAEGAKVIPLSFAIGKRILGLEVGINGQAVVSDFEMNVPYYPMIGKQELVITLSPGLNPQKYLEVQLQVLTPKPESTQQQSTSDKSTNSSQGGILSWLGSLVGSDQSSQSPSSSSSSSPSAPPKDIQVKDLTLTALIEHLKDSQSVQSEKSVVSRNNSVGILLNILGIDESRSIKRHFQVSVAAGLDINSRTTSIILSLDRSPVPEIETKPWKIGVAINVNLPTRLVDPSELLSKSYQKELEKQIQVHIRRHGESEYHRQIDREVPRQQTKVLQQLLSSTDTQQIIDEVVNTEISQSEEPSLNTQDKKINQLIRKQKQILKEVKNIHRRASDPLRVKSVRSMLSSVMRKSERVKKDLEKEIRSVPSNEESDALNKYSVLLQQIVEQILEESVRSSKQSLSSKNQQAVEKSLETSKESLRTILQQQSSPLVKPSQSQSSTIDPQSPAESSQQQQRQSDQSQQGSTQVSPSSPQPGVQSSKSNSQFLPTSSSQSPLTKSVLDLLQKQTEAIQEITKSKEAEGMKSIDEKKIKEAVYLAQGVDERIREEASTSSPQDFERLNQKLLKSVIQQQQITKCLEQRITKSYPKQSEKQKKEIKKLIQQSKLETDRMSKIMAVSIQHEIEKEEASRKHSPDDQKALKHLRKVHMSQVIASQQLSAAESSSEKSMVAGSKSMQRLQKSMNILDQTDKQIVSVVKQRYVKDRPIDVINKLIEVSQMQHSLLGLVAERAREELVQSVSRTETKDKQIETLEKRAEAEKLDYLQMVRKILASISSKRSYRNLSWSERQSLQGVHKELENIRSMQIKLEEKVRNMERNQEKSVKKVDLSSIKELVAKCKAIQDKIEKVESGIRSKRLHQMVDDTTKEPQWRIEIQEQIVEKVKELIPDSAMSSQEKESVQTSLNHQENKLEKLQEKLQELQMQESQQNSSSLSGFSPSQSPQPINTQQQEDEPQVVMFNSQDNADYDDEDDDSQPVDEVQRSTHKKSQSLKVRYNEKEIALTPRLKILPNKNLSNPVARGDLLAETEREVRISIKAEYGSQGEKKKYFDIQILGTPSLEQLLWERAQMSPLERSSITKKYLKEKSDGSEEVTAAYLKVSWELNLLRHLHVRAHYEREEIHRVVEEFGWWTHEAIKALLYPHLSTEYPHSFRPRDRLEIRMDFRRNNKQFDIELTLPEESNFFRGISIPYVGPFLFESTENIRGVIHRSLQKTLSSFTSRLPGQCEVKQNRIRSLDGKEYYVPDTKDCEVVLSMDCSSSKQFAVKSKKDSSDPSKRFLEVHVEGRLIEVVPSNSSVDVKVDGKKQDVPNDSSISIKISTSFSSKETSAIKISRHQSVVSILSLQKGVYITSDGSKISITISPLYYSQVCGMCGNFDGRQENEYQSPEKVDRIDPSCFVLDYLFPDGKCDSESVRKECQQPQVSFSSSRCMPESKTIRRTRLYKNKSQLCLSQNPVKSCPSNCEQKDTKSRAVKMVCFSHESAKARAWEKTSFKRPLAELKSQQADYTEYVQEPNSCREI